MQRTVLSMADNCPAFDKADHRIHIEVEHLNFSLMRRLFLKIQYM